MSTEIKATPWAYDELQLIGAELGDTIQFVDEEETANLGLIVFLTKSMIFVLTNDKKIIKFGRSSLTSVDGSLNIIGLAETEIRLSRKEWEETKKKIKLAKNKRKKKNENIL